ncbi:putative protein-S-isoprenylcysteine methyltransferase [Alkalibacterium sp. AK22]|uniref:methyltransferase family protein n=1 Tax=Alkalibacterium sp. AK22 TaxID=1229520 RepID=UPI000449E646|nr:isoprenylcysteine carboxylmethyltransferase family protein [Alkalibacterium sp. AK22]EXJ22979.1 putative protein-S-isoprenylcysteine methyltransferase [Alkalibacterium sp. AK22]
MDGHVLFTVSVGIWVLMETFVFFGLNKGTSKANKENKSKLIILTLIIFGVMGPVFLDPTAEAAFQASFNWFRYFGVLLVLLGVGLRFTAIRQLGISFSVNVGVPEGTDLKCDGLYGLVRHPSYTGELVSFLGVAVVYSHPVASLSAFLLPAAAFLYRIHTEEKILIASFGERYKEYQKETKKVIPFLY